MLFTLRLFMLIIQGVALATSAAAIYIIGIKKIDGVANEGKGEPVFLLSQFKYCKIATFILLIVGWFFCAPDIIGQFAQMCIIIGIVWGLLGAILMLTLIYCLFTKAEKPIRDYLRKFATGNITYGIFISLLSWLLWG